MARRLALLIGNTIFDDADTFPKLRTPANDAQDFAALLQQYGDFEFLSTLVDETVETIRGAIDELFSEAERGDLALLYYSGHGYLDQNRRHYLIARNTRSDRILSSGIRESFINEAMGHSRSRHQVIILDCCFSGAFVKGRKSGTEPLVLEKLKGEATALLASSGTIQYSFEEAGRNSLFTQFLLNGIETGQADENEDGQISIDELFRYAEQKVRDIRPEQTPTMELGVRVDMLHIAKNPKGSKLEQDYRKLEWLMAQAAWEEALFLALDIRARKSNYKDVQDLIRQIEAQIPEQFPHLSEMLRQALPSWQNQGQLLSQDNLRLVTAQRDHIKFSTDEELKMIYASAVSHNEYSNIWQPDLSAATRQQVLLQLMKHNEAFVRHQAADRLDVFANSEVVKTLVKTATGDSEGIVRETAARAIARLIRSGAQTVGKQAIEQLVEATRSENSKAAWQAITMVCDQHPSSHKLLPTVLYHLIVRWRVSVLRWRGNQGQILKKSGRGVVVGGVVFGVAMVGLVLGLDRPFGLGPMILLIFLGLPLNGVVGALSIGGGTFVRASLDSVQDYPQPKRTWFVTTLISALLMGLGFMSLSWITTGERPLFETLSAGFLIGLGLTGITVFPLKIARTRRLALTIVVGAVVFGLVGTLGLFFSQDVWWLLPVMGSIAGAGFFLAFDF